MNTQLVLLAVQAVLVGIVLTISGLSFSVSGIVSLIWHHPIFFTVCIVIPQAIRKIYGDDGKREKIEGSVFITGCDSGMGETTAVHLASKGFRVFAGVLFEASINSLKEKAKQISPSTADRLIPIQVDVTNPDNIQRALDFVKKSIASDAVGLVGIINCAAIAYIGPAEYLPIPEFRRVIEVNFMGYVSVTQAFLPLLKETTSKPGSRRGKIIFIGTGGGVPAPSPPLLSAYMASKWAVDAFSQSLRLELQLTKKRIDPVVINPGFIKPTGLYEAGKKFIEKLWTITPPEAKKEYGQFVDTFVTFGETQPATHVSEVANTMERAMVTTNTPLRYYVGYDSAASPIVGVLPTEWREWILKKSIFNL